MILPDIQCYTAFKNIHDRNIIIQPCILDIIALVFMFRFYEFQLLVTMICYNNNINSNICKMYLKIKKTAIFITAFNL